jgi:hypothetical protein
MRSMAVAVHSAFSPSTGVCIKSQTAAQAETGEVTKAERGYRLLATCIERARRLAERPEFPHQTSRIRQRPGAMNATSAVAPAASSSRHAPANRARLPPASVSIINAR